MTAPHTERYERRLFPPEQFSKASSVLNELSANGNKFRRLELKTSKATRPTDEAGRKRRERRRNSCAPSRTPPVRLARLRSRAIAIRVGAQAPAFSTMRRKSSRCWGQSVSDTGLVIAAEPGVDVGLGVGVSSGVGVGVVLDFG